MLNKNLKQRLIGAAVLIGVGIIIIPVLLGESAEILPEYKDSEIGDNFSSELEKSTFTSTVKELPTQDGKKLPSVVSAKEEKSSASSSKETKWFVQIGSFGHRENALRIHRDVTSFGYKAFIETAKKGGGTIYKVRVGPEKDGIRAKQIKKELERRLQTKAFVISPSDG